MITILIFMLFLPGSDIRGGIGGVGIGISSRESLFLRLECFHSDCCIAHFVAISASALGFGEFLWWWCYFEDVCGGFWVCGREEVLTL